MSKASLPVVALTLGDPSGIGAELIARLLARPQATERANLVLIGDPWLWEQGQRIAGLQVATAALAGLSAARERSSRARLWFT